jgi:ABC-type transport system substrate-binding protein
MNNLRKAGLSALLIGAAVTGGAVGASVIGTASAQTDSSSSSTTAAASTAAAPDPSQGGHTANGITEALLTGDTATQVTSAARAAVPGATVDRVENDAEGATYEAHMTKSDGSKVTVKVNADFSVASIEDGMK